MHTKSSNLKQRVNFYTVVKLKGQEEGRVGFELWLICQQYRHVLHLDFPFPKTKIH